MRRPGNPAPAERIPVAVLGATGMVGQRFAAMLEDHPWFRLAEVFASERSEGKPYAEAVEWRLPGEVPAGAAGLPVRRLDPRAVESPIAFSALSADLARTAETELASAGLAVISNASAHRMAAYVPLLVPEINPEHAGALRLRKGGDGRAGFIVTNPNCSTVGIALALAPLHRAYGLRRVVVTTLQALSGAGFPGVASLAIADNVIPWIAGESEKIEEEPRKILGGFDGARFLPAEFLVSARVHRVPVTDGHLAAISVETARPVSPKEAAEALRAFRGEPQALALPSAPRVPVHVVEGAGRPQPYLDRDRERGMAVTVGSIERCPVLGLRLESLVHNTVRGAAGAALLNAEWLLAKGHLDGIRGIAAGRPEAGR